MDFLSTIVYLWILCLVYKAVAQTSTQSCALPAESLEASSPGITAPKIMIISMWPPEAQVFQLRWPELNLGNLTAKVVTAPGFSMLYPVAYCTENEEVCNLTIGEGEINAAASMMALVLSSSFDFRRTYWMFAGIAGVSPKHGTVGSVALAKYAIQVGLQYEIDSRDLPESWPSGYIPYGQQYPFLYPRVTYGTEVFELNENLRDLAARIGSKAPIVDSDTPRQYRAQYGPDYPNAIKLPGVLSCDVATSDVYFSGKRLSEAFDNTASIWTNGSGIYCMSAQEENATLEIMVRGAIEGLVDFARVLVMRGGSNFDRPPPGTSDWAHLVHSDQNAFYISLDNLFNVGTAIIKGILDDWNCTFFAGIKPQNYIGDIFGSLGGEPDYGPGSITNNRPVGSQNRFGRAEHKKLIW